MAFPFWLSCVYLRPVFQFLVEISGVFIGFQPLIWLFFQSFAKLSAIFRFLATFYTPLYRQQIYVFLTFGGNEHILWGKTRRDGGKLMSFLESAHQSYIKSPITTPAPEHSKNFVGQCYVSVKL